MVIEVRDQEQRDQTDSSGGELPHQKVAIAGVRGIVMSYNEARAVHHVQPDYQEHPSSDQQNVVRPVQGLALAPGLVLTAHPDIQPTLSPCGCANDFIAR